MKLYYIERLDRADYDEYDSAVVAAESEEQARTILPDSPYSEDRPLRLRRGPVKFQPGNPAPYHNDWVELDQVVATYIGEAAAEITSPMVICASFNAG